MADLRIPIRLCFFQGPSPSSGDMAVGRDEMRKTQASPDTYRRPTAINQLFEYIAGCEAHRVSASLPQSLD